MIIENALLYHVEAIFKDDFGFVTLLHKLVSSIAQRYIRTDQ